MPVIRTSSSSLTPPPQTTSIPPTTGTEAPRTRRNLFKHRLEEKEHPEPWALNFTSLGDSTDVVSTHLPFDYLSSLRSPSSYTRMMTEERHYPMGYRYETPQMARRSRRQRGIYPPRRTIQRIDYDELLRGTPSPPPLYTPNDTQPPYQSSNSYDGEHPNYPAFSQIFAERVGYTKRRLDTYYLICPKDWRYRVADEKTFPVWKEGVTYGETGVDFAEVLEVCALLNVDGGVDYWRGTM